MKATVLYGPRDVRIEERVSTTAEQLSTTYRPDDTGLSWWTTRAARSFPVPVPPVINTDR
jgi:hypothetical protein